jgi:hypothetical protein
MNLSLPNDAFGSCRAAADINDEANNQVGQIEAPVESVGERAEVAVGVLGVSEGLVGARDHGLEVAQDGVDPIELRQISGLVLTHDFDGVSTPGVRYCCEARQALAKHAGACVQVGPGSGGYRLTGEAWHRRELNKARVALVSH